MSNSILEEVVENLDINFYVESVGEIMTTRVLKYPFNYKSIINNHEILINKSYLLQLYDNGLSITDLSNDKQYLFESFQFR